MFACRMRFRIREDCGVTSSSSSSRIHSSSCSSESLCAGRSWIPSSAVEARMFVSFFSLTTLTSMSSSRAPGPVVNQLRHAALAPPDLLGHHPAELLGAVDHQLLHRLLPNAVLGPSDHLRLPDRELEALPSHGLDQDRHLELAAARHDEDVGGIPRRHAQAHVREDLTLEPLPE